MSDALALLERGAGRRERAPPELDDAGLLDFPELPAVSGLPIGMARDFVPTRSGSGSGVGSRSGPTVIASGVAPENSTFTTSSTRRFNRRPSSVALSATGRVSA